MSKIVQIMDSHITKTRLNPILTNNILKLLRIFKTQLVGENKKFNVKAISI